MSRNSQRPGDSDQGDQKAKAAPKWEKEVAAEVEAFGARVYGTKKKPGEESSREYSMGTSFLGVSAKVSVKKLKDGVPVSDGNSSGPRASGK